LIAVEGADVTLPRYYVYILTNRSHTLYIGVTNDLERRVYQHKTKKFKGFTAKYNIDRLAYYETFRHIDDAIEREKELKGWRRIRKIELIESRNKYWNDLSADWYPVSPQKQKERTCSQLAGAEVR
jgi:putative endonuclease